MVGFQTSLPPNVSYLIAFIFVCRYDYSDVEKVCKAFVDQTQGAKTQKMNKRDAKGVVKVEEVKQAMRYLTPFLANLFTNRDIIDDTAVEKRPQMLSKDDKKSNSNKSSERSSPKHTPEQSAVKRRKTSSESEVDFDKNSSMSHKIVDLVEKIIPNSSTKYDDVYCICCTPTNAGETYIGCEICEDWFHYECVNLNPKSKIEEYVCKTCAMIKQDDL